MMPRPPALETAEASCVLAIQPIGACKIGYLAPVCAKTLFVCVFEIEWSIHQAQNTLPDFSYQLGTWLSTDDSMRLRLIFIVGVR